MGLVCQALARAGGGAGLRMGRKAQNARCCGVIWYLSAEETEGVGGGSDLGQGAPASTHLDKSAMSAGSSLSAGGIFSREWVWLVA